MKDTLGHLGCFTCTKSWPKSSTFHSLTIIFHFNFKISHSLKVRENFICKTLSHGAGKTEYVPLHTAAAFSSSGADWNTDFIKEGFWVGRISFQVSQGFRCSVSQERVQNPWKRISRHPDFSHEAGPECGNVMLCILWFWLSFTGPPVLLHALMQMWALEYHFFHSTGVFTLSVHTNLESDQVGHPQQQGFSSTK